MKKLLLLSLSVFSSPLLAQEAAKIAAPAAINPLNVLFGLLAVVALILALAWFLRRFGGGPLINPQGLKVISAISVGPRERVVLIEAGDKQLLLGVAPGRVSKLESYDEPIVVKGDTAANEFGNKLKQFLHPNEDKQ